LFLGALLWRGSSEIQIRIVELEEGKEGKPASIVMKAEVDHPYPATKVLWMPDTVRRSRLPLTLSFA
jgi:hypothetical protein